MPLNTVERIFALVDAKYKEQRDFADAIGVSASMVSQWRMGITKSYQKRLPQIAEALGTTTEYLLTGKEVSYPDHTVIRVSGRHNISEDAREVAFAYDDASPELQAAVRRVLGLEGS